MSSNAGPFNHYLMLLHTEMLSSGDTVGSSSGSSGGDRDNGGDEDPEGGGGQIPAYSLSFELLQDKDALKAHKLEGSVTVSTAAHGASSSNADGSGLAGDMMDVVCEATTAIATTTTTAAAETAHTVRLLHMVTLDDTDDPELKVRVHMIWMMDACACVNLMCTLHVYVSKSIS